MLKALGLAVLACLLTAANAFAQSCATYPNTLTNGTTADATQVMANFNCAALVGAAHFTGDVGIGTTTPLALLQINGGSGNSNVLFTNTTTGSSSGAYVGQLGGNDLFLVNQTATGNLYLGTNNTSRATITPAGALAVATSSPGSYIFFVNGAAAGTTAWTNTSDARLKENVTEITGALDLIDRLRGVWFEWRPPADREVGKTLSLPVGERQIGFIAQEVEKVVPEAVVVPKKGSDGVYAVKDGDLMPVVIEALKEQQAEIRQLKAELAALKAAK